MFVLIKIKTEIDSGLRLQMLTAMQKEIWEMYKDWLSDQEIIYNSDGESVDDTAQEFLDKIIVKDLTQSQLDTLTELEVLDDCEFPMWDDFIDDNSLEEEEDD